MGVGLVRFAVGGVRRLLQNKALRAAAKRGLKVAAEVGRDLAVGVTGYQAGKRAAPGGGSQRIPQGERGGGSPQHGACELKGYHLNRSAYYTSHGFVPAHSKCVRNRRMNPLNGHAARKAISRVKGARKMLQAIERSMPKRTVRSSFSKRAK